ncbi:MAG: hypothetical protein K2Q13_10225 [Nitrosomonas sp.]|uniref:hypothetical protein n=1 Tax=Nitrosomonas sp. TaxID=42353 RepID=UPI0025E1A90C|nr:hypothetical protein [Nitrosomonas sp.]MBY0475418.1 hypothetical protein [Nitrosomonas sp.]
MFQPVKKALGVYMGKYYASIIPTTKSLNEYIARGLPESIVWAPSRMVDTVEDMLGAWQREDVDNTPTNPVSMPVIIIAVAEEYIPSGRDYTRQISEEALFIFPDDFKERAFKLQAIAGDLRAQIVFAAHDEPTAKSLASQFLLYTDVAANRRFAAKYTFAGFDDMWPVQIESTDSPAMSIKTDAKNLTILAVDLTLKVSTPLFKAPADDEPNDGKGTPGNINDPSGYPVVDQVDFDAKTINKQTTVT